MKKTATMIATVLLPGIAAAHPEHTEAGSFGLLHYATDPFHLGLTGLAIALGLAVRRTMMRRAAPAAARE